MTDTKRLDVTDIDFESIRSNLKSYMQSQETLQDYDFEGSAITSIIDLLSYATHYNAVNANVGLNETFLNSAQFRGSVVGHARLLGYTPRSASSPVAFLDLVVNDAVVGQPIIIPRGHRFKTTVNNTAYDFVTTEEYRSEDKTFSNVRIAQVRFKTAEYVFDSNSSEKYVIPDIDVDTSTIEVTVLDSRNSSTSRVFSRAKSITGINSNSDVFFLSENPDEKFEISFGDGTVGTSLESGNIIRIEYGVTKKAESNGARIFSLVDSISGFSNISISTVQPARGGGERESIESIKRNAPITFASQNRGITPTDYEAVIRENFNNVSSVKVFGGEDADPPVYGKVFISIIPRETEILTDNEKSQILNNILIPKSVVSVTPEIIDPDLLFLNLNVNFKFDPSITTLSGAELERKVQEEVRRFNDEEIEKFNTVFRFSNLLNIIDSTNDAILNSFAQVFLEKRFVPSVGISRRYEIDYSVPLFASPDTGSIISSSSTFTIRGEDRCFLEDRLDQDSNRRIVSVVRGRDNNKRTVIRNVGRIENNKIILENFAPSSFDGSSIRIEVLPDVFDIAATFESVLSIGRINVVGNVDSIVAGEEFSGASYVSPSRIP